MILVKILQQFLLPSIFIPILILIGLIFLLKHKKISKLLIIMGVALYYFFSISPVSDLIISPLENKYLKLEQNELQQADNVVLLLGGPESDVLRASEALRIYNLKSKKPIIYIAGRNFLSKENLALKLKNYLIERGINEQHILVEDNSRTTVESAQNLEKILKSEPFFLITSAYHLLRSVWIFEKYNNNPIPAPTDFKIQNEYDLFDFFPAANKLKNVDTAFHEYFGFIYYKLKY